MLSRSVYGGLLAAALAIFLGARPGMAITDCLLPTYGDAYQFDREGYSEVPDSVLPAAFNAVFDLHVYWDWGTEEWWPDEEVIAFANLVMPDSTGATTPAGSYAHRTAEMFGADKNDLYAAIHFEYTWSGSAHDHGHFDIFIRNGGGSYATYSDGHSGAAER